MQKIKEIALPENENYLEKLMEQYPSIHPSICQVHPFYPLIFCSMPQDPPIAAHF
jgi:hypothetical protein